MKEKHNLVSEEKKQDSCPPKTRDDRETKNHSSTNPQKNEPCNSHLQTKKMPEINTPPQIQKNRINRVAIICLLFLVTAGMYPIMKFFLVPVILAASFVTLFFPLYKKLLIHLRGNKPFSSLTCCLILFLCFVIPFYIVFHLVTLQLISFIKTAEPFIKDIIAQGSNNLLFTKIQSLPFLDHFNIPSFDIFNLIQEFLKTFASIGSRVINKTSAGVLGFVTDILIMFFTMFYFFMDGENLINRIKYLSPIRDDYEDLISSKFLIISRATVMGTLITGLAQGTVGALCLLIFGIESWILWGFIMVILSIVPMVGSWAVLIPAGCVQLLTGNIWKGIAILVVSTVIVSNIDNLIRPRLVGKGAKLHDLIIFFSSLGGIAVFGIMGFIVGPVIAALFISVLEIYGIEFKPQLTAANKPQTDIADNKS